MKNTTRPDYDMGPGFLDRFGTVLAWIVAGVLALIAALTLLQ